jgi:hypothetical protein
LKVEFINNSSLLVKLFDTNKTLISDFECYVKYDFVYRDTQDHNPKWVLVHRFVAQESRGQKIGSRILKVIEECIQHIADKNNKSQTVIIDAYQLEIISFAQKNGYVPATEEDRVNADTILSGDRSKVIVADAPAQPNHSAKRQNFIYSVDKLREAAEAREMGDLTKEQIEARLGELMDNDFYSHKKNALVINFKKEIKPKLP